MHFITTHEDFARIAHTITPQEIEFNKGLAFTSLKASFGKAEVDTCAARLVRFFQARGAWIEFTTEEFLQFCISNKLEDIFGLGPFYGLAEDWWDDLGIFRGDMVRLRASGRLSVTDEFILRVANKREDIERIRNKKAA